MLVKLSIDDVVAVVGNYKRKRQDEYEFQCPICAECGRDRHRDNLKFNARKGIIQCFANQEHSKMLFKEIIEYKKKNGNFDDETDSLSFDNNYYTELTPEIKQEFMSYTLACNEALLKSEYLLSVLQELRGINANTVKETYIGYDSDKKCWVLPTVQYNTSIDSSDNDVIGFEYRPTDFSKKRLRREANMQTALAMINEYTVQRECLAVVEGYMDGYALFQYLTELNQINAYHIVTCSNGVQSLLKQIDNIDFAKYKKFYLFIDNDDVSRPVACKILEKYPFFNNITLACGCKDFNDHYLKCIKKQQLVHFD